MKSESTGLKLPVLIGVLLFAALIINVFVLKKAEIHREAKAQEQQQATAAAQAKQAADQLAQDKKDAEEARQQLSKTAEAKKLRDEADTKAKAEETRKKLAQDSAAEHARLLARYLNSGFSRKPGVVAIAVAIESEQGTINPAIGNAIAQRFTSQNVQVINSLFKPEFVADKFVDSIFSGDTAIFDQLELTNSLNGVLIGRQTITYSTNTSLENTITANLRFETIAVPFGASGKSQSWSLSANGVGLNNFDARVQAENRIIHQISDDSTMSLSNLAPNK